MAAKVLATVLWEGIIVVSTTPGDATVIVLPYQLAYDVRKELNWEVWPAYHNAGRAAVISTSLLDTGVFTPCPLPIMQP